ncbi:MAG TPA: GNAT family N-acetyltransferase [Armatimonadota bacterium]|nr:GNAT family N-acetyltransferase [Armatimonadota bacterium]
MMRLEGAVPESVLLFYSRSAGYPLGTLPAGRITVAGLAAREPAPRRSVLSAHVFHDRALLTVPPQLVGCLEKMCQPLASSSCLLDGDVREMLQEILRQTYGDRLPLSCYAGVKLYCDAAGFHPIADSHVCRITRENASQVIEALQGVDIPSDAAYLLADGTAFAYFLDEQPVAFAGTHPVGDMAANIGNVMVGTLEAFRRRGYGRAVVAATTHALIARGRTAVYGTDEVNTASINTARSVGYRSFCRVFAVRV